MDEIIVEPTAAEVTYYGTRLKWYDQSVFSELILIVGVYIMAYRQLAQLGLFLALVLVVGWGFTRDPLLLGVALLIGFITGLIVWLLR